MGVSLRRRLGRAISIDGEVGAVHAAEVATRTFLGSCEMWGMITFRIESRAQLKAVGGAKRDTKAAALTAIKVYNDGPSRHGEPLLQGSL
jgi:hypothetical protein